MSLATFLKLCALIFLSVTPALAAKKYDVTIWKGGGYREENKPEDGYVIQSALDTCYSIDKEGYGYGSIEVRQVIPIWSWNSILKFARF